MNQTAPPPTIIQASGGWPAIDWRELWAHRELLYFLAWRDLKVRYKQTWLGVAWVLLQPVLTMLIFTVIFGLLAGLGRQTGDIPYPVYVYTGLVVWLFFSNTVANSGNALAGNAHLITKIYFPRLLLPLSAAATGLVDLAISIGLLGLILVPFGVPLTWQMMWLPVPLSGLIMVAVGLGSLVAALGLVYRDFRYLVPFILQLGMYATPIIYPASLVPADWRWVLALNPLAGLVDGFRAVFLGAPLDWTSLGVSWLFCFLALVGGLRVFRRYERFAADLV